MEERDVCAYQHTNYFNQVEKSEPPSLQSSFVSVPGYRTNLTGINPVDETGFTRLDQVFPAQYLSREETFSELEDSRA
jgi:hypothetical protein